MDRTGLYGLYDLGGAPPDPEAARTLGLAPPGRGAGPVAAALDLADPGAAQSLSGDRTLTLFLGRLDERAALAQRLGMASDASDVALAETALARFGPDIRTLLHGEWTLAHWSDGALTLVASLCLRDPLFYAVCGDRIAIGPDLRQLSRIGWVGDTIDPTGLLMAVGRASLRAPGDVRTLVAGISTLAPGAFVAIDRNGIRTAPPAPVSIDSDWQGDLDAAMAAAEALILRIVRQRMIGGGYACMLSGGLDSSTLAWATARTVSRHERLQFLTSAATPGSAQVDEVAEAAIVASYLGVAHDRVTAGKRPGAYRPDPTLFRDANGPSLDVRHYLYHRFAEQCRAADTPLLFDGQFGELTFTNSEPLGKKPARFRAARDALRTRLWPRRVPTRDAAFHVLLASHWRDAPPQSLRDALDHPIDLVQLPAPGALWGISAGFAKAARAPASLALGQVRVAMPFRDPRLIGLFAGLPAAMLYPKPGVRTPALRLLADKLPDTIRLRAKGPGFAPDYSDRLRTEGEAARARIAVFRRAEAQEWIDLEALDRGLDRAARGTTASHGEATRVQLTAMAGEFIAWWRGVS